MTTTTVDLLRHGALVGGLRYRGATEAALSEEGRAAMDVVWTQLAGSVDGIITSPLSRCREPAAGWAEQAGISCVVCDDLREMHYGEWEGMDAEEIERRFPGELSRWRRNPVGMRIPGAETIEGFSGRVAAAWRQILCDYDGRHALLVAHSGTLRAIIAHVLDAPLSTTRRFAMPYASWSRVAVERGCCRLEHLNQPLQNTV